MDPIMLDGAQVFAPGRVIDQKYQIDALIGSGGMGEVYAATHVKIVLARLPGPAAKRSHKPR